MVEPVEQLFKSASSHFEAGDYKKAEPLLHQLVLKNYKSAKLFYMLGAIQYQKNDIKKALRSFKRSLEIDPKFTDSGIGLSVIYNDLGHYSEGQKRFAEAQNNISTPEQNTEKNEKAELFVKKHLELAQLYHKETNYLESLQQLIKAKAFGHDLEKTQVFIAECLLHLKEYQKALNELKSILQRNAQYTPALMRLGQIYYKMGQKSLAIQSFEKILLYDPDNKLADAKLKQIKALNPRMTSSQGEVNV